MSLLISIIFIFSFVSMAVCAHPGHGSEYVEEVPSSQAPATSQVQSSSGESSHSSSSGDSSSGSSGGSSSSSGGSGYSSTSKASGGSSSSDLSSDSSSGISEVKDNSTAENVNETNNGTNSSVNETLSENNGLFTVNNVIMLIIALFSGFFIAVIISKLLFEK